MVWIYYWQQSHWLLGCELDALVTKLLSDYTGLFSSITCSEVLYMKPCKCSYKMHPSGQQAYLISTGALLYQKLWYCFDPKKYQHKCSPPCNHPILRRQIVKSWKTMLCSQNSCSKSVQLKLPEFACVFDHLAQKVAWKAIFTDCKGFQATSTETCATCIWSRVRIMAAWTLILWITKLRRSRKFHSMVSIALLASMFLGHQARGWRICLCSSQ